MDALTPTALPNAVKRVFELNHHSVEGPVKVNGAEIDLIATPVANPFAPKIYIEVTTQYVDNTKYGKDLTKLMMARASDRSAVVLIVSSSGFTADVRERALATDVETLTYDELFARFEKFQPYVERYLGDSESAAELRRLADVYERPSFVDRHGEHDALDWMAEWIADDSARKSWLLIVGEYGTGKSALTKILQRQWLEQYRSDPSAPIPVRIELGDFNKQLDAQGLLHHFLDHNGLSHVPIDFFWSLIRAGRVVLLLDGYDEMAQYLSQRERRATLKALAELSTDGVRGLLTSRPNYFTESEELSLFESLYKEISIRSEFAIGLRDEIAEKEQQIDNLIQRSILDRFERALQDLSPEQSRALVNHILRDRPDAATTVNRILERVFRTTGEGSEVALSGKPVIISYLIEVAASLKETDAVKLSEWDVYTLIVDRLGLRDLEQTARVGAAERRKFLQLLAIQMTVRGRREIDEDDFRRLIETAFPRQLRRLSGATRVAEIDSLFQDLRRSGTLTRSSTAADVAWRFSHNSIREFLVAEAMVDDLTTGRPLVSAPPVSDAMRAFVTSSGKEGQGFLDALTSAWSDLGSNPAVGSYLGLVWDSLHLGGMRKSRLEEIAGTPVRADRVSLTSLDLSELGLPCSYENASFRECVLFDVSFRAARATAANFAGSLLEAVTFDDADLAGATFDDAVLVDVSVSRAVLEGATFLRLNDDVSILTETRDGVRRLEGKPALGLLAYLGAAVDEIDPYFIWMHHPKFAIVEKISSKIVEGGQRQRRGLEQRGAAAADPKYAREFVRHLETSGLVRTPLGRSDLVEITTRGRAELSKIQSGAALPAVITKFLEEH